MVKYCGQPFEGDGQIGLAVDGEIKRIIELSSNAFKNTGFKCGTWQGMKIYELKDNNTLYYYVCRNCLLEQGLIW